MSIVLVTGGSGFVGQHLVAALCERRHHVRVLDLVPGDLPGEVEFVRGSILDEHGLSKAMTGASEVYHLAAIANLWLRDKSDFERINVHGTERVLRIAQERGIKRLVHCSSAASLLSNTRAPNATIDENTRLHDSDLAGPYTRSKHRAERAVMAAAQRGLDAVVVNPTLPIGAGDRSHTPPTAMLARFLNGSSPAYLDCIFNLVDVRDVAAGLILAAERGRAGQRYILGGENLLLSDLLRRLELLSGRPMPQRALPASIAMVSATILEGISDWITGQPPVATREGVALALHAGRFDSTKARRELGYSPRPIEDALRDAIHWIQSPHPCKQALSA